MCVYVVCVPSCPRCVAHHGTGLLIKRSLCVCMCVFWGRSSWQEALGPENICRRPQRNTPAHTHTHTHTHTGTYTHIHRHMNIHNYTHHRHLATHTLENTEIHTCKHTRRPVERCHCHCRHTSGTVTIATQDWPCHPGLVRWVTARESER